MNYQLDPRDKVQFLNEIWSEYEQNSRLMLANLAERVVSWKWGTSVMFPEHPLFGQADTTPQAEPWRPFKDRWISDDDPLTNELSAGKHGFDEDSRIILVQKEHFGIAYFHHDGYCNQFRFRWDNDTGVRSKDEYKRCKRIVYDNARRIEYIARYSHEYDTKYYSFEWFKYDRDVCVSSLRQNFNLMQELPHYHRDSTEEQLGASYRPVQGDAFVNNLVETRFQRKKVVYSYDSGQLVKAEVFDGDGKPKDDLLFEKLPERPLGEIVAELVSSTATTIFKSGKKRAQGKPYRALALVYSAEHAHCGLPHGVKTVLADQAVPEEPSQWESFEQDLDVTFKRPVLRLLTEFNQRCYSEFGMKDISGEFNAARDVIRGVATYLAENLKGTKHVTGDFQVFCIDDHGDVPSECV